MKHRKCRNCKKTYSVPGIKPGACSVKCYQIRRQKKANPGALGPWFYDSIDWKRIRYRAIVKYGRTCMACGASNCEIHVDHIKSVYLAPHLALDVENLQILCRDCNLGKGGFDQTDFRPK